MFWGPVRLVEYPGLIISCFLIHLSFVDFVSEYGFCLPTQAPATTRTRAPPPHAVPHIPAPATPP